jgi:hypothetical protein
MVQLPLLEVLLHLLCSTAAAGASRDKVEVMTDGVRARTTNTSDLKK